MRSIECAFEPDVVLGVRTGRWPERVDDDLRRHAATCPVCADAIVVTRAMAEAAAMDDEVAAADLRLPSAGAVWLRAEVRARAEAARTATRPITWAQVAAIVCLAAAAGALFGATSSWFQHGLSRAWNAVAAIDVRMFSGAPLAAPVVAALSEHMLLGCVLAAFVLLTPVAIHLAAKED
jgi:hypothetical protein